MELSPVINPQSWREDYQELFENESITTAYDYVEYFTDHNFTSDERIASLLKEMGTSLYPFERVFPSANQDLAIVFINPGLNWRDSDPELDDNYQLSRAQPDNMTRRCAISMDAAFKYLFKHNTSDNRYNRVGDVLQQISTETSLMSGLTATLDRPIEFFTDVYYTNWYKFGTAGSSNIPTKVAKPDSFVSRNLREELALVDPELVLVFGRLPWENAIRPYCEPIGAAPVNSNITAAQNYLYECTLSQNLFHVIPYNHPAARQQAVDHDPDQLRKSLDMFRDQT